MDKKLLTLVLTMGLFFATVGTVLADIVPISQIYSQPGHSVIYNRVSEVSNQYPSNYFVYEVLDNKDSIGDSVLVGWYQWIGSDMTKGTVKVEDANGNPIHAMITPAQYAAGQYPGGTPTVTATPKPVATPAPVVSKSTATAVVAPVKLSTPVQTSTPAQNNTTPVTPTPVTTTEPVQVNPPAEVQQTPEQVAVKVVELKDRMEEAKISVNAYRQLLNVEEVKAPDKPLGFWKRFTLWFASL